LSPGERASTLGVKGDGPATDYGPMSGSLDRSSTRRTVSDLPTLGITG
jgi:hypothetical protein